MLWRHNNITSTLTLALKYIFLFIIISPSGYLLFRLYVCDGWCVFSIQSVFNTSNWFFNLKNSVDFVIIHTNRHYKFKCFFFPVRPFYGIEFMEKDREDSQHPLVFSSCSIFHLNELTEKVKWKPPFCHRLSCWPLTRCWRQKVTWGGRKDVTRRWRRGRLITRGETRFDNLTLKKI